MTANQQGGQWVKLDFLNMSDQGRLNTVFRSFSRRAQRILVVYGITNSPSFHCAKRFVELINEHAPQGLQDSSQELVTHGLQLSSCNRAGVPAQKKKAQPYSRSASCITSASSSPLKLPALCSCSTAWKRPVGPTQCSGHCLLHRCTAQRQTPTASHLKSLSTGKGIQDAPALQLTGRWGRQWWPQGLWPQAVLVHPFQN